MPLIAQDTDSGFHLTGFTGLTPPMVAATERTASITVTRDFVLGPNPARVTLAAAGDFELINSGGDLSLPVPTTDITLTARVFESDRGITSGPLVAEQSFTLLGNAVEVFDFDPLADTEPTSFILGPGVNYTLEFVFTQTVALPNVTNINLVPQVVVISEFGSAFDNQSGFAVDLSFQLLPEPSSAALIAAGGLALLRRRRTA